MINSVDEIYNYLYNFINSDKAAKRKTSAGVFEDFLAILLNGIVADTQIKKNLDFQVSNYFINVKDKMAGSTREKANIFLVIIIVSVSKTLMAINIKINMGSFEKKMLFDSLKVNNYLSKEKASMMLM